MRQKSLDKRLQSEKRRQVRKEKSKEAARCRRGKEGEVFSDIIDTLPVADSVKAALDKTSIIRLCINYIKSRDLLGNVCMFDDISSYTSDFGPSVGEAVEVLHGFVLMLSPTAEVVYVTSNIKQLLGICEYDVIGHSLDMFVHPGDWEETEKQITSNKVSLGFTARFNSHHSVRPKGTNFKPSSYKSMRFSGRRLMADIKPDENGMSECLVLTVTPIEHPSAVRVPLDSMTFTSKHSLDMRFTQCDQQTTDLTSYSESCLVGKSFYDFIHPSDIKSLSTAFKALSSKQHIVTDMYRFLTSGGGYINMCTQASIATDPKSNKALHILCVHHTISEPTETGVILSDVQLIEGSVKVKHEKVQEEVCNGTVKPSLSTGEMAVARQPGDEYVFDDIMDTTAGVFMDPVEESACDLDIMRDTESIFGDDPSSDGITGGAFSHMGAKSSEVSGKTALEALVEELDNDTIDMNRGLFVLPDVDEKDYCLRAPYIPMEDYADMPMIDSWCYDVTSPLPSPTKQDTDWKSYRQDGTQCSPTTLPSPVPSYSPGLSANSCSPATADSPPWLIDGDNGDLISDLQQLSYTESDHGGYSKSDDTTFTSVSDMKDCLDGRLSFTNADVQQQTTPTSHTHGGGATYILNNVPAQPDLSHLPSNTNHTCDITQGQQYGYRKRKRKASEIYSLEQSPVEATVGSTGAVIGTVYKSGRAKVMQGSDSGQYLIKRPNQHSASSLAAADAAEVRFISRLLDDWQSLPKQLNQAPLHSSSAPDGNISKSSPPVNVVKALSPHNTGWLATTPHPNPDIKYKPTLQKGASTAIDRDKKVAEKVANSLLLDLLRQS